MKKALIALFGLILTTAAFTQAVVTNSNEMVDVTLEVLVPCSGETIELEGTLHFKNHMTINGNNFNYKSHAQPQGLQGYGDQGNRYNGVGVTRSGQTGSFSGYPFQFTEVNNFRMIGQGQAPNYHLHFNRHITVNANGDVTSEVDNTRITCE